jgi:hypothetical protein
LSATIAEATPLAVAILLPTKVSCLLTTIVSLPTPVVRFRITTADSKAEHRDQHTE